MIDRVFDHCPGIGPRMDERIRRAGYHTWKECLENPSGLPLSAKMKGPFVDEIQRGMEALKREDITFFTRVFHNRHHWRILDRFFDRATFFDIETTGLSMIDHRVTVVVALDRGELHTFVEGENLDDFIDFADSRELLVTFNGACFDIPFLERSFHIPGFQAPHIDLRWVSWHSGLRGGLKVLEKKLGIHRPADLVDWDGIEALNLYYRWKAGHPECRPKLIRYCSADTIASRLVTLAILERMGSGPADLWPAGFGLLDPAKEDALSP